MKRFVSIFILLLVCSGTVLAADKATALKKADIPVASAPPVESEQAIDWKNLQAQEQWVARLKKQTEGEVRQLSEMRNQFAEKYKLDAKKLDAGAYTYDEKKDAFVER